MNKTFSIFFFILIIVACKKTDTKPSTPITYCTDGTKVAHYYLGFFDYHVYDTYLYDNKNRLVEIVGKFKYYFDNSGNLNRIDQSGKNGSLYGYYELFYDSAGRVSKYQYTQGNVLQDFFLFTYTANMVREEDHRSGKYNGYIEYYLDSNGNVFRYLNHDSTGKVHLKQEFIYDNHPVPYFGFQFSPPFISSKNNITDIKYSYTDSTQIYESTYTYTYNHNGFPVWAKFSTTESNADDQSYKLDYYCE